MAKSNSRTELLLGPSAMARLRDANILCVGVGGVGGHAAEMLVRAGIGHITIVDGDKVDESNLNRQIAAIFPTIGMSKVTAMKERLQQINPELEVKTFDKFLLDSDMEPLLTDGGYSYIADAIDSIGAKCALIECAFKHGIPIVSSMGAGARTDISKIHIDKLCRTHHDGLAKAVRKRISNKDITNRLDVVFSSEEPNPNAIEESSEGIRKSIIGTVGWIPASFGCHMARHIILKLTEK